MAQGNARLASAVEALLAIPDSILTSGGTKTIVEMLDLPPVFSTEKFRRCPVTALGLVRSVSGLLADRPDDSCEDADGRVNTIKRTGLIVRGTATPRAGSTTGGCFGGEVLPRPRTQQTRYRSRNWDVFRPQPFVTGKARRPVSGGGRYGGYGPVGEILTNCGAGGGARRGRTSGARPGRMSESRSTGSQSLASLTESLAVGGGGGVVVGGGVAVDGGVGNSSRTWVTRWQAGGVASCRGSPSEAAGGLVNDPAQTGGAAATARSVGGSHTVWHLENSPVKRVYSYEWGVKIADLRGQQDAWRQKTQDRTTGVLYY